MKDLRALFSLAARYQWFRAVAVLSFWASSSNGPAAAQTVQPVPAMQAQPGYYRLKMGDVNITALSDGTVPLDTHPLLLSITAAQTDKLLAAGYQRNPVEASVNAYIIELGSRLVMVDAGTGELLGPTLDRLTTSMRAAGYQSEQFTDILVTHIHSDHTGGLTAGTRRVFPNATLHISQVEADFWLSEANAQNPAYARLQHWFAEAHAKVDPYVKAGKVQFFVGDGPLLPGIRTVAAHGHTPGHTFYVLESQGQKLVFWGDVVHVAAVQFPHPEVTVTFDVDPQLAATVRQQAFADAARHGYWVALDHVSFPGIGHVRAAVAGYEWQPLNYSTLATDQ